VPTDPFLRTQLLLWLAVAAAPLLLGVVALLAVDQQPDVPVPLLVALVGALTLAMLVAIAAVERLLLAAPPATDGEALAAYRTRFLVQLALSELPGLLAFAMTVAFGPPWLGLVGGLGSLACAASFRPTRDRLGRMDRAWQARGHDVSMLRLIERAARVQPDGPGRD
jgi:hypothetical protein